MKLRVIAVLSVILLLTALPFAGAQQKKPVTVDDLFKLASIVDVRLSPQGDRVAYVVSRPSLVKNQHEAALFVVSAAGGTPAATGVVGSHLEHAASGAEAAMVAGRREAFISWTQRSGAAGVCCRRDRR